MNASASGGFPRAAPEGLLACVLLAFLATAGLFYVNIMAALVAGLIDGLGFTNRQAGFVGSANVYGAACGAMIAVFLVRRFPWRRIEVVALSVLLMLDLISTQVTTPGAADRAALRPRRGRRHFGRDRAGGDRAHANSRSRVRDAVDRAVRRGRSRPDVPAAARSPVRSAGAVSRARDLHVDHAADAAVPRRVPAARTRACARRRAGRLCGGPRC